MRYSPEIILYLPWQTVATRVAEAYNHIAPAGMATLDPTTVQVLPPDRPMTAEEIDPFLGQHARELLSTLEERCAALPETVRGTAFGGPVWKAGKKTFVTPHFRDGRLCLQFWVGVEQQGLLCNDRRYRVPPYSGAKGWIELDVHEHQDWGEIGHLLLNSYRHFNQWSPWSKLDPEAVYTWSGPDDGPGARLAGGVTRR